ncbi:GNAT family N-acetyltransferase [Curtobacterium sp. C1]|uniref:GNAT family N-acetyltransferase n=1 Tax=Curtobacterium TaxID=2034 RepID=UPI000736E487|nr:MULTISPECIES: GNAT family N-acetyltransferase [Curtobacterium]KTR19360.1 acetyltransferase [Curtobacterium citreum]QKS12228.1 GNAT family N-acetyltransferase [Curtobacterium sp. csp3]QKS19811.1 GNAT family N-acetyltransferase [Curtobacterium sp. Csp1]UFU14922.1 GNAT family N-acetyltransferase [Curtobacterium sp. C1]
MPEATPTLTIAELDSPADATAFRTLNEAWIERYFTLEDEDRAILGDPVGRIVEPGGAVFVARLDDEVIGCVGLMPVGERVYELVKMAVSPEHQGHGTGRKLIAAALDRARVLGAQRVALESASRLASAVHLYEAFGFRHLEHDEIAPSPYARADVHMVLDLV